MTPEAVTTDVLLFSIEAAESSLVIQQRAVAGPRFDHSGRLDHTPEVVHCFHRASLGQRPRTPGPPRNDLGREGWELITDTISTRGVNPYITG